METNTNTEPEVWRHDEQRDGSGCTWCGSYAKVNEDNLCEPCFEDD